MKRSTTFLSALVLAVFAGGALAATDDLDVRRLNSSLDQLSSDPTLGGYAQAEQARARENDPRRQEGMQAARATMADIFDGPPEFVDLVVVDEHAP